MTYLSFKPAWWLPGGHVQTLWPALLRRTISPVTRRERVELPDGDFIDVDWAGEAGPIVIVLHGLGGSLDSHYARGILRAVAARGWRGALMHFRGCGGEPNRLLRGYHAGDTGDLASFVALLRQREPHTPLTAVGYSLGGNVLLKWLGEQGDDSPLAAAAAVSVPFDLGAATARMRQGFSRIYDQRLLRCLQDALTRKSAVMDLPWDAAAIAAIATLREFDERITAPLHGFRDAEDYYDRASCRSYLPRINTPTLIVHAADDPFMPLSVVPLAHQFSATTCLELSPSGGHVGFVSGAPWAPRYWLEARIPEYLSLKLTVPVQPRGVARL
ncbi:MAG: hydrolase [Pseudomonadota bacterium]